MDGCLSWGHWQLFLSFREDESPFFEKFELDPNVGWEHICGGAKQIHPGLHPIIRTMKGAALQFRSIMPSTAQRVCSLWTHADEFIHIYSLSEDFQAKLPDCSVHQPKKTHTTSLVCLLVCIAPLSGEGASCTGVRR